MHTNGLITQHPKRIMTIQTLILKTLILKALILKKMILKITLIATLGLFIQTPLLAGVYKWVDEAGQVHYGERPGNTGAERVKIQNTKSTPVIDVADKESESGKKTVTENSENTSENTSEKPGDNLVNEPEVTKKPDISKKERNRLCKEGKGDYETISSRGRMREINKKGEYTYLTEKQRQQRLAAAKKKIKKYCR